MARVAIIDADVLAYRAAHAAGNEVDWGDGDVTVDIDPDRIAQVVDETVAEWTKFVQCDTPLLVQSDPARRTFRSAVHPRYKQQRVATKKPAALKPAEEYIRSAYRARSIPGLEGDDVIGMYATNKPDACVVVSTDKDMLTLPVRVCIIPPHNKSLTLARKYKLTEAQANYNWMKQTIVGDSSDNYLGAPGVGATGAREALIEGSDLPTLWGCVLGAFLEAWDVRKRFHAKWVHPGDIVAEALMNARCARILRIGDYDTKKNRVRLWTPEGEEVWTNL